MIHYHGTPMTPTYDAARFFRAKHAMLSFATHQRGGADQMPVIAEVAQSFVLDNGAFTAWKAGAPVVDWSEFYRWSAHWLKHPACDWALVPDVIDGNEDDNDVLLNQWPFGRVLGVPVWHLHESIERLVRLCDEWPRVALGSSGQFAQIGTAGWWERIAEAMNAIADADGVPARKLHGLRMLDREIVARIPFSSADSTNAARNMGLDSKWSGPYVPTSEDVRALVIADRIESASVASRWQRPTASQQRFTLSSSPLFGGCA